jgi:hypothetical protein
MKINRGFLMVIFVSLLLSGAPQDEVTLLRWGGPPGTKPGTFGEWITSHPYTNFRVTDSSKVRGAPRGKTAAIFTEQSIASSLQNEINGLFLIFR